MRIPPPVLALMAALGQRAMTRDAPAPSRARAVAAGAAAAASVVVASAASAQFQRVGTTVDPMDPARASVLVTTGANSLTRNPMYVGLTGLLLSQAIRRGSWAALAPVAAFALVMDKVQIPPEEAALQARFGADYEAYRNRVPRWFGSPLSGV